VVVVVELAGWAASVIRRVKEVAEPGKGYSTRWVMTRRAGSFGAADVGYRSPLTCYYLTHG